VGSDQKQIIIKKVCIAYHSCVKRLLNLSRYSRNHTICATYGMPTCEVLIAKNSFLLSRFISNSTNSLLQAYLASHLSRDGILFSNNLVSRQFHLLDCNLSICTKADITRALHRCIADIALQQIEARDAHLD